MLNPKELQVLTLLAQGLNYKEIAAKSGVHPLQMPIFCYRIRQKTGIESTKSQAQCKSWLEQNPDPKTAQPLPTVRIPTPKQRHAMELYAVHRQNFDQMAHIMETTKQNVENFLVKGMIRARIEPRGPTSDRRAEIVAYLQKDPMADPAF